MRQNNFGRLPPVSTLTLGGGGIGMVWGETSFEECVATVQAAAAAGINLIDLAPRYGDGTAERVVGEAFGGRLPTGVRVTSKCNLGNPPRGEIGPLLRQSIEGSLTRLHLSRLDLFFLHSNRFPAARRGVRRHSRGIGTSLRAIARHRYARPRSEEQARTRRVRCGGRGRVAASRTDGLGRPSRARIAPSSELLAGDHRANEGTRLFDCSPSGAQLWMKEVPHMDHLRPDL